MSYTLTTEMTDVGIISLISLIISTVSISLGYINSNYEISRWYVTLVIMLAIIGYIVMRKYFNTETPTKEDTEYNMNVKLFRNQPYPVHYTNPYLTNLDKIDFNFRKLYNNGNDISFYMANKLQELLIGKYLVFHKVLSYKSDTLWNPKNINYNASKTLSELKEEGQICKTFNIIPINTNKNKISNDTSIIWARKGIFRLPANGYTDDNNNQFKEKSGDSDNFLYIFELNDLNEYKIKDTISIITNTISDQYTDINTNELDISKQYVYWLGKYLKDSFVLKERKGSISGGNNMSGGDSILRDELQVNKLKPFIMLFKNNVRRPIYYKNSVDLLQQKNYRNWLLDTYLLIINEQFKYRTFLIKAEYKQLNSSNITIDLFENSVTSNNYSWKGYNVGSIAFNKSIYKEHIYNKGVGRINNNDMGFIITIKNAVLPLDEDGNEIGYVDANNRSLSKYILPYLEIYHLNYGSIKNYLPNTDTLNYSNLNTILKQFDRKKNIINFTERDYVDEYTIYNYNPKPKVNELVKVNRNDFNDQMNKMNNNNDNLLPTSIGNNDVDLNMYITNLFVNTKTIKDYTIKMKLIADTIFTRFHSDKIESIDNYSYNLSELQIIKLYLRNKTYYFGNNEIFSLGNKIIKSHNLNRLYVDIKVLRQEFITWLNDKMSNLWVIPTDGFRSLEHIMDVINQTPYDSNSKELNINIENHSDDVNKGELKTILTNMSVSSNELLNNKFYKIKDLSGQDNALNNVRFIKFENSNSGESKICPVFRYSNKYVQFIDKVIEGSRLESMDNIISMYDKFYDYKNMRSISITNNLLNIHLIKDDPNILVVEYDSTSDNENSLSYIIGTLNKKIKYLNLNKNNDLDNYSITSIYNTKLLMGTYNIHSNKYYINITKETSLTNIEYYSDNGVKVLPLGELSGVSNSSSFYILYSTDKLHKNLQSNINISIDSNVRTTIHVDNGNYRDILQINRKSFINSTGDTINYKYLEYKSKKTKFFSQTDINLIKTTFKETDNMGNVEYVFQAGINNTVNLSVNTNFRVLLDNILWNECLHIYYNIPKNIGIIEVNRDTSIPTLMYGSDIFIPYKYRKQPINQSYVLDTDRLCQINSTINYNKLNINSKYKLFDFDSYKEFYTNILKNIIGIYVDIHKRCNEYYESKSDVMPLLPQSLFNYISFDMDMLYYRSDEELTKSSLILKKELDNPVVINNNIFTSKYINISSSNTLNTDKIKEFLKAIINQKNIGNGGYEYDIAEELCKRIYTIENKECSIKEYNNNSINNKERDKCFDTVVNTFTKKEEEKKKKEGTWMFSSNPEDREKIPKKYKSIETHQSYIGNTEHVKKALYYSDDINSYYNKDWLEMDSNETYWIDNSDRKLKSEGHSSLIQVQYDKDNKEKSNILTVNNPENNGLKGVICFGRAPNTERFINEQEKLERFREKELLEHVNILKKKDFSKEDIAQRSYELYD